MLILAVVELITLHLVDGRSVLINPRQVTQVQEARSEGDPKKQMHDKVRCVVRLTDSTYVSVAEECVEVKRLMEEAKP